MNNILRQIESEHGVIYIDQTYSVELLNKCKDIFESMLEEGIFVKCKFSNKKWMAYSDLKHIGLSFNIDEGSYYSHLGKELNISYQTIIYMLKCYAIYCCGVYVFVSIAKEKINTIKVFLQKYKETDYKETPSRKETIQEFLEFIMIPMEQIKQIKRAIRSKKVPEYARNRKLKPMINYLAIEHEVNRLYRSDELDDESFIRWFPIFFWVNISLIIPLRTTEILVTPLNCIERKDDKVFIKIRRTKLKKRKKTVYCDVNKDYELQFLNCFDGWTISVIEKYIQMTSEHERRFLFDYNKHMINDMVSLPAFNLLIKQFIDEKIIGNKRYEFALFASGIKEFSYVTAGDSRPLAIGNMAFQDNGKDIVKEWANHENSQTTGGYYDAVAEIIRGTSIMQHLDKLEYANRMRKEAYIFSEQNALDLDKSICTSPKIAMDKTNLDDCREKNHLNDHMGCPFYRPSRKELDAYLKENKKKLIESSTEALKIIDNAASIKGQDISFEEIFLKVQTYANRYKTGCDIEVEEIGKEWQKLKNTQKTCY